MTVDDPIIVSAFGSGFVTLSTVIAIMWKRLSAEHRELMRRSVDCENDRKTLFQAVAELKGDAEMLSRCPSEKCPMKSKGEDKADRASTRIFLPPTNTQPA